MSKRGKLALILGGGAVILAGGLVGVGHWWIASQLSKERLVELMESSWNCRAHLDDARLRLWASPSRLELVNCKLAERDGEAGKPLAGRLPMDERRVRMVIESATLELSLTDLISRRIDVQMLAFSGVTVREDVDKSGNSSLGMMFSKPRPMAAAASATPAITPAESAPQAATLLPQSPEPPVAAATLEPPSPAPVNNAERKPPAIKEEKVFQAGELAFSITAREAWLERCNMRVVNRKSKTNLDLTDIALKIKDVDVDPRDLAAHNSFKLGLDGRIRVEGGAKIDGVNKAVQIANLNLNGGGEVHPFNAETGQWSPISSLEFLLRKDTALAGYMTMGQTGSKDLNKLKDYGLNLDDVLIGGTLAEDAHVKITFDQGHITLLDDTHLALPDYELTLLAGSWLDSEKDEHEMQIRLTCGPKLQESLRLGVTNAGLGEQQAEAVVKAFSDEKGRLFFDLKSTGKLSKPNVKPDTGKLLNRLLDGLGGDLLKGLLQGN